ncbi:argininosuccinate lyase [Clostridium sp. YIM B02505]|uniref:Argininosuccinate lyase n=1 Tax=Clostridium yunnanense TaxID=2800325 RepID=A0ABS1EMK8_9CLOT|nr:argininosuccinate lyase [Clostridium yunnanense]MBK1810569.1 argininosuccinate lyase [Clostridium yunnanense]
MKLWGGRFQKETNSLVNAFHSSISFDYRLYEEDIRGSIAHAKMLASCNVISFDDMEKIVEGLKNILVNIENGEVNFSEDAEDIHMNVETMLINSIGEVGKKLHTGRSRNDQVALDLRMYVKKDIDKLKNLILKLENSIYKIASENVDTIMPGYTHLQKAQPITFCHHLLAYGEMFKRDYSRLEDCYKRMNVSPLGSGALATTTYPLDRYMVAEELGFDDVTMNSLDGVSDRDYVIELNSALAIIMMHLSRFSEEIILWCTGEFGFIELDDGFSTGSSIMPQKKNPDVAELVRGKTGRVYGGLITLLTMMKGLPLAYNKDMQEDKEAIFDSLDTVKLCIDVFSDMLSTVKVNKGRMRDAAGEGFTNATDGADYLVKKGMPFRDAHKVIGQLVFYCIEKKIKLEDVTLEEFKEFSSLFDKDIYEALDLKNCVERREVVGGPSKSSLSIQLDNLKYFIKKEYK